MVFDDSITLSQWIVEVGFDFLLASGILCLAGIVFSFLIAALQYGPSEAFYFVSRILFQIIPDFVRTSWGRIFALARLAVLETLGKRVVVVAVAIFSAMLLGGGWFLNMNTRHPDQVYIDFVYFGTQLLLGLFGMLIASFSLPSDIKSRTIYTVVTKPVRSSEIVIGRVLGFGFVGTVMLLLIWIASFLFVERGLNHTHDLSQTKFQRIEKDGMSALSGGRVSATTIYEGKSSTANNHWHLIEVTKDGRVNVQVPPQNGGHAHDLIVQTGSYSGPINADENLTIRATVEDGELVVKDTETGETADYWLGPPTGILMARERIRASELYFLDDRGTEREKGINVGNEWDYRSFIKGGPSSLARAIFTIDGFAESKFADPEVIQLDLNNMSIVRTNKGNIEKGVSGQIEIRGLTDEYEYRTRPIVFEADEYAIKTIRINRKQVDCVRTELEGENPQKVIDEFDLFDEIGASGEIEVILRCNEGGQYFGVAKNDVYFLTSEGNFAFNFAKAYVGIWLQMMFIISVSVMFSTFLSGIVSMVAVLSTIVLGSFQALIAELREGVMEGGGPIESFYRIYTQTNQVTPLDEGMYKTVIKSLDSIFLGVVEYMTYLVPDFSRLNFSEPLVAGFNIATAPFLIAICIAFTFCFMTILVGYFILKTREIAK